MSELVAVLRTTTLWYASISKYKFSINDLVPDSALRDVSTLDDTSCINISQPPLKGVDYDMFISNNSSLQHTEGKKSIEIEDDEDNIKLFMQEHVQFLHQQYLGSRRAQKKVANKHPIWKQLPEKTYYWHGMTQDVRSLRRHS